jgi:enoyl-[acyl-carrier-protein] reductase (NADH)
MQTIGLIILGLFVLLGIMFFGIKDDDFRINIVRSRAIKTNAFANTFGNDVYDFLRRFVSEEWLVTVDEVAKAAFGLCSGMFDAMNGQTAMADRGNTFADGIFIIYQNREELGL